MVAAPLSLSLASSPCCCWRDYSLVGRFKSLSVCIARCVCVVRRANLSQLAERLGLGSSTGAGGLMKLSHAAFGLVLGADGKKLSSRDGVDLTLEELLNQGVQVAAIATTTSLAERSTQQHQYDLVTSSLLYPADVDAAGAAGARQASQDAMTAKVSAAWPRAVARD